MKKPPEGNLRIFAMLAVARMTGLAENMRLANTPQVLSILAVSSSWE